MADQLNKMRNEIDAIDNELLRLVNTRADLAKQIGQAKNKEKSIALIGKRRF